MSSGKFPAQSWQQFPIVVSDGRYFAPPGQQGPVGYYGDYPYQLVPQYPRHSQEPNFIQVVPPKPKGKKKKTKPRQRIFPKDTMKLVDGRPRPQKPREVPDEDEDVELVQSRKPNSRPEKLRQRPAMDIKLVQAVQQPNSKFVVDKFFFVPGRHVAKIQSSETVPPKTSQLVRMTTKKVRDAVMSQKLELQKQNDEDDDVESVTVKVESVGMTAADQPIPDYSAYFPQTVFTQAGKGDEATLILEPNSKAISGNDGTSISTPISRAILRRGTAVKVLFRPQSVAITGAYGVAHAQADLILDFIEDE